MTSYEEVQKNREDAENLLNNPFFAKLINSLRAGIEDREMKINTAKEPELAQDVIRFKQLLNSLERTILLAIKKGEVEEKKLIKELQKKTPLERVFKR